MVSFCATKFPQCCEWGDGEMITCKKWDFSKSPTTGITSHKVDKHIELMRHRWRPFIRGSNGEKKVLGAGNYEWPFKIDLKGDTPESVEGIPEASITYRLKATIARGKLAHDITTYKPLRVIRTPEPAALEFLHAMSVENIWPNKVDYSIVIPSKAVIFGASIPLEMRFTPLLKGLEMGDITVKLIEVRDCVTPGVPAREHRQERDVESWSFSCTREEHWQDTIGETGQEGWSMTKRLDLPKRLKQCIQDVNHHGIKIRHKVKLVVGLKNPDGHVSELRATLPVAIFISPNMPLDESGDLVESATAASAPEADVATMAPPGYGEHVLDQLFEDVDPEGGFQTPAVASGVNSPFYAQSRAASTENLSTLAMTSAGAGAVGSTTSAATGVAPADLSSRLANIFREPSDRERSITFAPSTYAPSSMTATAPTPGGTDAPGFTSYSAPQTNAYPSRPASRALSRQTSNSEDDHEHGSNSGSEQEHLQSNPSMPYRSRDALRSGRASPEHVEFPDMAELSKVPSYSTARRTPVRSRAPSRGETLPDYFSATSTPSTPAVGDGLNVDPLSMIREGVVMTGSGEQATAAVAASSSGAGLAGTSGSSSPVVRSRPVSSSELGTTAHGHGHQGNQQPQQPQQQQQSPQPPHYHQGMDHERRLRILQGRDQASPS